MSIFNNVNNVLGSNVAGPGQDDLFSSSSVDHVLAGDVPLTDGFLRILSGPSAADQSNTTPIALLSNTDGNHPSAPFSLLIGDNDRPLFDIDLLSGSYGQAAAVDLDVGPDWGFPLLPDMVGIDLFREPSRGGTSIELLSHKVIDLTDLMETTGLSDLGNQVLDALDAPLDQVFDTVDGATGGVLDDVLGGVLGGTGGLDLEGVLNGVLGGVTGGEGPLGILDGVLGEDGILGGITGGDGGPLGLLDGVLGEDGILGGITGGDGDLLEGILGDDGLLGGVLGSVSGEASGGIDLGGLIDGLTGGITGSLDLGGGNADGEVSGGINLGGLLGGSGLVGGLLGGVLSH